MKLLNSGKFIGILLVTALLASCSDGGGGISRSSSGSFSPILSGPSGNAENSSDNIGDSINSAKNIPLTSSGTGSFSSAIDSQDDNDYYKISISTSGTYTMSTTGDMDTAGTLFDSNGQQLTSNDDGDSGDDFSITSVLTTEVYYVRVAGFGGSTGNYTISISWTDNVGDSIDSARNILLNDSGSGSFSSAIDSLDDNDYYKISISTSGTYTISTSGITATIGTLVDSNGQKIASNYYGGLANNFSITSALSTEVYYVRVTGGDGSTGNYTISISRDSSGGNSSDNVGDSIVNARDIWLESGSGSFSSAIDNQDDSDYYKINISTSGAYTISTSGDMGTVGTLFDSNGQQLTSNNESGSENDFSITRALSTEVYFYFIRVTGFGGSTGNYTVSISRDSSDGNSSDNVGDSIDSAKNISLKSGSGSFSSAIDSLDDNDYYKISISTSGTYTISTSGDIDTVGTLFDSNDQQLAQDDDRLGRNFSITSDLSAEVYYIRVAGYYGSIGNYTIYIDRDSSGGNSSDNVGDSINIARDISLTSFGSGLFPSAIDSEGDNDYYKISISTSGTYIISTSGSMDTVVTLFDSNGQELTSNDDGDSGIDFSITRVLSTEVYYIRVTGFGGSTGNYTIWISRADNVGEPTPTPGPSVFRNIDVTAQSVHVLDINSYYSQHVHGPTLNLFHSVNESVVVSVHPGTDYASGSVHIFRLEDAAEIFKWLNNQYSDGLFIDPPNPISFNIDADDISIVATTFVGAQTGIEGDEYDIFNVEYSVKDHGVEDFYNLQSFNFNTQVFVMTKDIE